MTDQTQTQNATGRAFALVREQGPFRALMAAKAMGDREVAELLSRTMDQARVLASGGAL